MGLEFFWGGDSGVSDRRGPGHPRSLKYRVSIEGVWEFAMDDSWPLSFSWPREVGTIKARLFMELF